MNNQSQTYNSNNNSIEKKETSIGATCTG